ncbi:hypothetical protein BDA99DRAFT_507483 [Phascolomyces articulosus]|uniref:C2 domain-containing protein n=1 Tax=Phascolomyces articulosus TaxID=60185 RepID=A0AAD5K227_9FUNG|nr:hypothetical protein BDA99DRAFT_507483 [Phascolomyces articulosus]
MFGGKRTNSQQKQQQFDIGDLDELLNSPLPDSSHDDHDDTDLNDPELLRQLQELTSSSGNANAKAAAEQKAKAKAQQQKVQEQRRRQLEQRKQRGDIENLDLDSYAALAQGGEDDVEVELNEADFSDPTLLKELSALTEDAGQGMEDNHDYAMEQQPQQQKQAQQQQKNPPCETAVQLMNMGFTQQQAENALAIYDGNAERATNYLLDAPSPLLEVSEPPVQQQEELVHMQLTTMKPTTIETVPDEDDAMDTHPPVEREEEEEEPDVEELQRQSKQYQQQALAAKRQGDKKKAVELLRKSKALAQKYNELIEIQQALQPLKSVAEPMEDVQRTSPPPPLPPTKENDNKKSLEETSDTDTRTRSPSSVTSSPPPVAATKNTTTTTPTSTVDPRQLLQDIIQLQKEYKEAAHHYKDLGNLTAAKEMVKVSKELLRVGIQVKNGEANDLGSIQRKLPSKPDMTLGDGKIRHIQHVEVSGGPAATLEHLESQLTYQIDVCHNLAVQAASSSNTKRQASRSKTLAGSNQAHFQQLEQAFTADMVSLRSRRDQNQNTTPQLHYEHVEYTYKNILDHIPVNQMELRIIRGIELQSMDIASEVEPYVTWDFGGWPPENAAQAALGKGETAVKKGTSPEFDITVQIPIVRGNRAFLRYLQRRRLTLEVFHNRYSYGLFRRPLSLGKILIPMDQLLTKASISGTFDLTDGSRRKTGGKLEVQINLREPLTGEDIVRRSERWLIIDEFGKNTGEILAAAGLASGLMTTTTTYISSSPSPSNMNPEQQSTPTPSPAATTTNTTTAANATSSSISVEKNSSSSSVSSEVVSSPPKENTELEEAEEELNSTDSIISNMVLDYEINIANNALTSGKALDTTTKEDLMDRKQGLDIKMNMLVIQVQTGVLDMDTYLSNVRKRMDRDRQLALIFKKHNRLDLAKIALARKKIMQDEIDEATAAMAEQQAGEEAN